MRWAERAALKYMLREADANAISCPEMAKLQIVYALELIQRHEAEVELSAIPQCGSVQ